MEETTKQKRKKRPARKRKKRPAALANNPLPPPVDAGTKPEPPQQSSEPKSGGLFGGLFNPHPNPEPSPQAASDGLENSSTSSYDAEAQRLLDSVPDSITPEGGETGAETNANVPGTSPEGIPFPVIVNAKALGTIFQGALGVVGSLRKRDCYDLDDESALKLGEAWQQPAEQWLERILPTFLTQFAMANPGLVSAIITTVGVLTPMVKADFAQGREERKKRSTFVREGTSHAQQPAKPKGVGGMLHDLGEVA